jgi:hypothetical protein
MRVPFCDEQLLEIVDQLVAFRPDRFRNQIVHPHDEDVFVMRAVEDDDLALGRRPLMRAPEKVVRRFLGARLLETEHRRALRIHAAEQVADDAILAGRVERLQDDQQRLVAVGVEQGLQLGHARDVFLDLRQRLFRRGMATGVRRVDGGQLEFLARG